MAGFIDSHLRIGANMELVVYNVASDFVNNIEIQSAEPKLLFVFFLCCWLKLAQKSWEVRHFFK